MPPDLRGSLLQGSLSQVEGQQPLQKGCGLGLGLGFRV